MEGLQGITQYTVYKIKRQGDVAFVLTKTGDVSMLCLPFEFICFQQLTLTGGLLFAGRSAARPVSREVVVCFHWPRVSASARPSVKRSVRPAVLRVVSRCPLRAFSARCPGAPHRRAAEFSARGSGPFASAPPPAFLWFRPFCAPRALMRPAPLRSNRASRRVSGSSLRDGP